MDKFAAQIKSIRKSLGFNTTKSFYQDLRSRGLQCNYSHFSKIAQGAALPSAELVNQLALALPKEFGEKLILAFCADQFPRFQRLFSSSDGPSTQQAKSVTSPGQIELTHRQVAVIGQSQNHYFLFLLCTLARRPLKIAELEKHFPQKILSQAIADLARDEILWLNPDHSVRSFAPDLRFPEATIPQFKEIFERLDQWDREFAKRFELTPLIQKLMIRRISPRYVKLVEKQLGVVFDTLRLSDETDTRHNNEVLHLVVQLNRGNLPG
ncbi:MAG: hypothetical protein N2578_06325 [Bdellovibrionaceae bacterium]|nr:hypothetical protein [Pseudobdellovibrionaceae bacterium]